MDGTGRKAGWLPLPADPVQPHRVVESLECRHAAVAEIESLTRGELSHHVRDEYLAGIGLGADAGGELDGGPEQGGVLRHPPPGGEADTAGEGRLSARLVAGGQLPLDGDGAGEGAGGGGERSHDPVPRVLYLGPTVDVQGVTENGVMRAQDLLGLVVTQSLGERGGALHVRKQDGLRPLADLRGCLWPFLTQKEVLDGSDKGLSVPQRDDVNVTLQGHEAGAGDAGGDLPSLLEGAGLVAPAVQDQRRRGYLGQQRRNLILEGGGRGAKGA